ncbi:DUF4407 domain-containing protein [Nocardia sp. NPDC052566]|uniref:DUF4407 domain-containing protein n=1 Tax=Nocardia sp. NPDC052566 TaxID=3364330 RepID=UPI0037CBE4E2
MTVTGIFTWLGGGQHSELNEAHERSGYAVTGAVVLLFAAVAGTITTLALAATGTWSLWATIFLAVLVTALAAAVGRALATVRPGRMPDRLGLIARIAVAVLFGGVIAELAAIVLFGSTVERLLDEKAQRTASSAPAVIAANTELTRAKAERTALDQSIAKAQADVDRTLVIARCELSPAPECPALGTTRVPGRGPEALTANDMLEDARKQLAGERAKVDGIDKRITDGEKALTAAESTAAATPERGLGPRWQAMNDYTVDSALPLRVLTILTLIALALLPLIMRWWRGDTFFDRRLAARLVQDQAERTADEAIAVKRAEVRAEAETLRAEQQLTAARLAVEADTAIDRERQRTRIIAAIGGLEIGVTEPPRLDEATRRTELPAGTTGDRTQEGTMTPNLPAPVTGNALTPATSGGALAPQAPRGGGLELPIIGMVPFSDTAARLIRPLVPSFVANAIDTATHPLRTARQAFEEVEEITFTLRRTRKVTVDSQDSHGAVPGVPQPGYQLPPSSPDALHAHRVAATVVDADPHYAALPPATEPQATALAPADRNDELPTRRRLQLPGRRGPRELPPAN